MATYPTILVGDTVTADLLNSMQPDFASKPSTTNRPSNVTLTDDPDLVTPTLAANGTYLVEFNVRYATTLAAGFQMRWSVPAGVTSAGYDVIGLGKTSTTGAVDNTPSGTAFSTRNGVHGYGTIIPLGSRDDVTLSVHVYSTSVVVLGGTAGTVAFAWAQAVSTAVNTNVGAASWVRTTRLA